MIDLTYLKSMSGNDADTERELLKLLCQQLPTEAAEMERLIAAKDWEALKVACHQFKSTLVYTGAQVLIEANAAIAKCLVGKPPSSWPNDIPRLFKPISKNLPAVNAALKKHLKKR